MVEMFTHCSKITDPPGNAKRIYIQGHCVEGLEKYSFGTFIDKFGNGLTQTDGTATLLYEDLFVESISLLMTVLKFYPVFFCPVDLSTTEDNINERSQNRQKLSQF